MGRHESYKMKLRGDWRWVVNHEGPFGAQYQDFDFYSDRDGMLLQGVEKRTSGFFSVKSQL